MCLDCDFERDNVDLKFVSVISVVVIVIVFGSEIFFWVEPQIGLNPLTGPVGPAGPGWGGSGAREKNPLS